MSSCKILSTLTLSLLIYKVGEKDTYLTGLLGEWTSHLLPANGLEILKAESQALFSHKWFPTGMWACFPTENTGQYLETLLIVSIWGCLQPVLSGQRPMMLLNVPQCTGMLSTTPNALRSARATFINMLMKNLFLKPYELGLSLFTSFRSGDTRNSMT